MCVRVFVCVSVCLTIGSHCVLGFHCTVALLKWVFGLLAPRSVSQLVLHSGLGLVSDWSWPQAMFGDLVFHILPSSPMVGFLMSAICFGVVGRAGGVVQ
jgi:hypothetical protein